MKNSTHTTWNSSNAIHFFLLTPCIIEFTYFRVSNERKYLTEMQRTFCMHFFPHSSAFYKSRNKCGFWSFLWFFFYLKLVYFLMAPFWRQWLSTECSTEERIKIQKKNPCWQGLMELDSNKVPFLLYAYERFYYDIFWRNSILHNLRFLSENITHC